MTVPSRSWYSALWVLAGTAAFAGVWYLAAVRGSTEDALGLAWIAGSLVAVVGLIVTVLLLARAFSTGTRPTPTRLAITAVLCLAIVGLIAGIAYVGG